MTSMRVGILCAAAAALGASSVSAQVPLTPRALGMGGAYVAVARGHETVFLNAANLGLAGNPGWSIAFPQVAIGASSVGVELQDIQDILNYDDLDDARRQEILANIPASGTGLEADVRAPFLAVQRGNVAFGVSYNAVGSHGAARDLVELFLEGYQTGRTNYQVTGNTRGDRATWVDFALAHGRSIGPVSVGATAHYYMGRSMARSGLTNVSYTLQNVAAVDIQAEYAGISSTGGSGYGLDVGAAFQPMPNLTLSASVANLVSNMDWDEDLTLRRVVMNRNDFENGELSEIRDRYDTSEGPYSDAAAGDSIRKLATELRAGIEDNQFPRTLRAGASFQVLPGTTLAASYTDDLEEGRLSGTWASSIAAGVQQKLPIGTLRLGLASDMEDATMLSGGLSLGPVQLGIARVNNGGTSNSVDREGFIFSFGLSASSSIRR